MFGLIVFLISYSIGSTTKLSVEDAENLKKEFKDKIKDIDQFGIFLNNVKIALSMFIPGFGIGMGIFSGIGTGLVFSAFSTTEKILENVNPLSILLTPFGILEIIAYGIAISRSSMLIYENLIKKTSWKNSLKPVIIEIIIVVVILFAAAIIEWIMIDQLGGLNIK